VDFRVSRFDRIRKLSRPEDGLRALANRAPEAEAYAERMMERYRPAITWLYFSRRRLATAAVCLLTGWFFLHVMFGANGMVVYRQKRNEYQELQKQVESLQKENEQYTHDIKSLQSDPGTIEKEAREQLHYARPGEVIYVAPPKPPQPSSNRASRK
jgi:cell division protein FtsB